MAEATRSKVKASDASAPPRRIAVGAIFSCTAEDPKDFCFVIVTDVYASGTIRMREIGTEQRTLHHPDSFVFFPEPSHQLIPGGRSWTIQEDGGLDRVYPADGGNWFMELIDADYSGQLADDLMMY